MKKAIAPLLLALTACSDGEEAPSPAPTPDTFDISQSDLWREQPTDFCRAADPEFLQNLMARAGLQLSPELRSTMTFVDFNVAHTMLSPAAQGSNAEAVLRFKVASSGSDPVMMVAAGPFKEQGCAIGELSVAEGTSTLIFSD